MIKSWSYISLRPSSPRIAVLRRGSSSSFAISKDEVCLLYIVKKNEICRPVMFKNSGNIFHSRGFLTAADVYTLFRDVYRKWIEGENYDLSIDDVRDEIWDMVKPADPPRITLVDMLNCRQGGTIASMLTDVRGFWAHDNRENLLQEEEEVVEEEDE